MNSAGVTYAAAAGHLVADILAEATPRFDPADFLPERFGERARDLGWLQSEVSAVVSRGYAKAVL
jgi:hypothetical protein